MLGKSPSLRRRRCSRVDIHVVIRSQIGKPLDEHGHALLLRNVVHDPFELRFVSDGEFLTVMKKSKTRPWALEGGLEPAANTIIAFPGTDREMRMSTKRVPVSTGDRISVLTAGGGGYGDPKTRDREKVRQDVIDELVSPEMARKIYGWK